MTTTAQVLKPNLATFAKELLAHGYKVYLPTSDVKRVANGGLPQVGHWFQFSREVNGQTCFASVSTTYFDSAEFSMPIRPTRENGSSMWIGKSANRTMGYSEPLSLENAALYASPSAYNPLVGTQKNFNDPVWQAKLYVEVDA